MERNNDTSPRERIARDEAIRVALDAISDLKEAGVRADIARKLDEAADSLAAEESVTASAKPRIFGAFAGKFTIGPEFFEAMGEDERRSWSSD